MMLSSCDEKTHGRMTAKEEDELDDWVESMTVKEDDSNNNKYVVARNVTGISRSADSID